MNKEYPKIPYDICRCQGVDCPVREDCLRFTDKGEGGYRVAWTDRLCNIDDKEYKCQIKEYY